MLADSGRDERKVAFGCLPELRIEDGEVWEVRFREKLRPSSVCVVRSGKNKGKTKYRAKVWARLGDGPMRKYTWFIPHILSNMLAANKSFVRLTSTYTVWRDKWAILIKDNQTGTIMSESKKDILKVLCRYATQGVEDAARNKALTKSVVQYVCEYRTQAEKFFPNDPEAQQKCMSTLAEWIMTWGKMHNIKPCPPMSFERFTAFTTHLAESPFNPLDPNDKSWKEAKGTVAAQKHGFKDEQHLMQVYGANLDVIKMYEQCLLYAQEVWPGRPYAQALFVECIGTLLLNQGKLPMHEKGALYIVTEARQRRYEYRKEA